MDMNSYTVFTNQQLLAQGELAAILPQLLAATGQSQPLIFEDATGREVDFDLRGGLQAVLERYAGRAEPEPSAAPQGRGRPKLGVTAKEITLLPRHWAWLEQQPKSASATIRLLIEKAIKAQAGSGSDARDAAARAMSSLAGNLSGFEEAYRALYNRDAARFEAHTQGWPADIVAYITRLSAPAFNRSI